VSFVDKLEQNHGTDPSEVDPDAAFQGPDLDLPLKPGEYLVEIQRDHSEEKKTRLGGEMLKLDMEIVAPEYSGRRIFPQFITDCPSNRDFEQKELDRVLAIYHAIGGDGLPQEGVSDFIDGTLIVETGLERSEYQGDVEYQPTIWGVAPQSDGPPSGSWPDDEQPDVWQEAVDHAKGDDGSDSGGDTGGDGDTSGGKTEPFDDDDLDF